MKIGKFLKAVGMLLEPEKKSPYPAGTFFMVLGYKRGHPVPFLLASGWDWKQVFNQKLWPAEGYDERVTIVIHAFNPRQVIMRDFPIQADDNIDWTQFIQGIAVIPGAGVSMKDIDGIIMPGDGMAPPPKGTEI